MGKYVTDQSSVGICLCRRCAGPVDVGDVKITAQSTTDRGSLIPWSVSCRCFQAVYRPDQGEMMILELVMPGCVESAINKYLHGYQLVLEFHRGKSQLLR